MTLISILIALLIEKYSNWHASLRNTDWLCSYANWAYSKLADYKWIDGTIALVLIITPVIVIVGLIASILDGYHSVYAFIFGIVVLSYSMGPKKFHEEIQKFVHSKKQGNDENAAWYLDNVLGKDASNDDPFLILKLIKAILIQTSRRLLSLLFWFVILGPIGAALSRLSSAIHDDRVENNDDSPLAHAAARLQYILNWIPSRLTALSYAITGSFAHAADCWRNTPSSNDTVIDKNDEILTCIGLSALQLNSTEQQENSQGLDIGSVNETLKLSLRSVIVWVTILAVLTLVGWMS